MKPCTELHDQLSIHLPYDDFRNATMWQIDPDTYQINVTDDLAVKRITGRLTTPITNALRGVTQNPNATFIVSTEPPLLLPGRLRQPGFVMVWNDLVDLYTPMIGYAGIGLWTYLRRLTMRKRSHPLHSYAWPGQRHLVNHSGLEGRTRVLNTMLSLINAELVTRSPASDHPTAARLLSDPVNSHIYLVHDPLQLPQFCIRWGHAITLQPTIAFTDYPATVPSAWVPILSSLGYPVVTPEIWKRIDLGQLDLPDSV